MTQYTLELAATLARHAGWETVLNHDCLHVGRLDDQSIFGRAATLQISDHTGWEGKTYHLKLEGEKANRQRIYLFLRGLR
jgi:hypothetical protein